MYKTLVCALALVGCAQAIDPVETPALLQPGSLVDFDGQSPITRAAACLALQQPGQWHCEPTLNKDFSGTLVQSGAWCVYEGRNIYLVDCWPGKDSCVVDATEVSSTLGGTVEIVDGVASYDLETGSGTCELATYNFQTVQN